MIALAMVACGIGHAAEVPGSNGVAAITPADPVSIQAVIEDAVTQGSKHVVIPPGVYRLPGVEEPRKTGWHLRFHDLKDVEIDASGVTLILMDPQMHGIGFFGCQGTTFRGARVQRNTPPASQGTIEAIDPGGKSVDIRIAEGYPADLTNRQKFDHFWSMIFGADRTEMLASLRAREPLDIKPLEPGLFRINLLDTIASIPVPVKTGMHVAWRGIVRDDIRIQNCAAMKLIDVTVAGGEGMVFHELGGAGGNLYSGCKITYPPRPEGATEDPLFATAADGLHSHDIARGPTLEHCLFEGIGDDAIAIHGGYAMAAEAAGKRLVAWVFNETRDPMYCRSGETLRFYDQAGVSAGEATVTAVRPLPGYQPALKPKAVYRWLQEPSKDYFVEITLDREAPANFVGGLLANASRTGSGYVIRDCTVRASCARGVMAKGSDGLVEGCTFERTFRAGVEFMTEMEIWSESDYARNVVVRNNTFRRVALNRQPGYLRHPGAITMFNYHANTEDPDLSKRTGAYVENPGGHRNILVEGNTIEDVNGPNLLITSAQGVVVRNNRFIRPMESRLGLGAEKGVDLDSLVWMTQCSGVSFAGNEVIDAGPGMKKLVTATATAHGTGLDTGFQVVPPAAVPATSAATDDSGRVAAP